MALVQEIKDGKVVDSSASQSKKTDTDSKSNTYDKEMFLKLLVAEMQYQDPLEPTRIQSMYPNLHLFHRSKPYSPYRVRCLRSRQTHWSESMLSYWMTISTFPEK